MDGTNEIKVPAFTANEEVVILKEVYAADGQAHAIGDDLAILESSKAAFVLEAESDGHVVVFAPEGSRVTIGQTIGYVKAEPFSKAELAGIKAEATQLESADAGDVIKVSRKAQALLAQHGLAAEEIADGGVITVRMIEGYLAGQATDEVDAAVDAEWAALEAVMQSFESGEVGIKDVTWLKKVLSYIDNVYSRKWRRHLPPTEILFDRWKTAEHYGFGEGSNISSMSHISGDVRIGPRTFVGPFCLLDGSGGLTIGRWCSIAAGVKIYSHDTVARALTGGKAQVTRAATSIGDNCFIGPGSVITRGVKIGDHCFVGANSVVTADVPDHTAVQGNPARRFANVEIGDDGNFRMQPNEA